MQTTITTFDNTAEGWERSLYAFLAEKERRSGSRRTVEGYSRMLRHFFGTAGKPLGRITGQDVFAWAYGTGLSGKPPMSLATTVLGLPSRTPGGKRSSSGSAKPTRKPPNATSNHCCVSEANARRLLTNPGAGTRTIGSQVWGNLSMSLGVCRSPIWAKP